MISVTLDLNPINVASNAAMGVGMGFASKEAVQKNIALVAAEMAAKIDPEIERHATHGTLGHLFEINSSSTIDWRGKINHSSPGKKAYKIDFKTVPTSGGGAGQSSAILSISASLLQDKGGMVMPIESKVQAQAEKKGIELKTHIYPNSPAYLENTRSATRVVGTGAYRATPGSVGNPKKVVVPTRANYAVKNSAPWTSPHYNKFQNFLSKYMTAFFVSRKGDMQKSFAPGARMVVSVMYESDRQFRLRGVTPVVRPGFHLVDGKGPYMGYRRIRPIESYAKGKMMAAVNAKTAAYFAKHYPMVRL